MKIDIHSHTKKCKTGDAPTRAISASDFCETVLATEVRIIAITNHNVFDLEQYQEIAARIDKSIQVWPGIEIDVVEDGARGHLLVVVAPGHAAGFSEAVEAFTEDSTPDSFTASIEDVVATFDGFAPLYIAHYRQKKPDLSDEAIGKLLASVEKPCCVIKEVTNSISAGIFISHGHASIYGSDVHDWAKYEETARDLPDLRLPVDSFEHFCLLLEKDATTINTVLNRKTAEELLLMPFGDSKFLKVRAYNDINVIFGPKGTGKTCILRAIARYYTENGIDAEVYESASDRLDDIFDTRGREITINLASHDIDPCVDEIEALRAAAEVDVTSLSKYTTYFSTETTNRNAKKILLKDIEPEEESAPRREFEAFNKAAITTIDFLGFLDENPAVKGALTAEELAEVSGILAKLRDRLEEKEWANFSAWKEIWLLNSAIETFWREIERKTGAPAKPLSTGFKDYALNRMKIELSAAKIVKSVETAIPAVVEIIGSLGANKGDLELRTEFSVQTGSVTSGSLAAFKGVKKTAQKKFIEKIRKILKFAYSDQLFAAVAELKEVEDGEAIVSAYELLMFRRYFAIEGTQYSPSSGEASMVMLQKELEDDKEIYILDEPERSLGNEYINDIIVPLIKERARAGKKVFISTHDANIAVRTLPYCSIYRAHGPDGYGTYIGNPFSNNLVNPEDETDTLDWKKVSMRTLEGGEEAFGERGKIYGSN